jgi:hypothetical protein
VRNAGGSVIGPDGTNLTGDAEGQKAFEDFLKEMCSNSSGKLHDLLTAMEQAARDAAQLAAMNALPTTKPKCHSKPIVRLSVGCDAEVSMVARNKNEEDCGG